MLCHQREIESPKCLNCNHPVEKPLHVLQCKNEATILHFESLVRTKLDSTLKEQKTDPKLNKIIIEILCKVRKGENINHNDYPSDHGLRNAIRKQDGNLK